MRRNSLFWGVLILIAGLFLLVNNLFPSLFNGVSVWDIIWPLAIVLIGVSMLLGPILGRRNLETQSVSVPLDNASDGDVRLYHGAGRLSVRAAGTPGVLLSGACVGGADVDVSRSGPSTRVNLKSRAAEYWFGFPNFQGPYGYAWDLLLTPEIPLRLTLETGASESSLDLRDLKLTDLEIKTGASATVVTLPANAGSTRVKISSGAASVKLYLPEGVAGHIRIQSGLAGIYIDPNRFPPVAGGYETPGYALAANKADIFVETGVGSVEIR
jgi:hypothetical protein